MEFKINREHFASGLQKVQNIAGGRTATSILNNVLLEAKDNHVSLTTTNLDLGIHCKIKAEVSKPGAITLPVRKLSTIVRALPNLEVTFSASTPHSAKITSGGSHFRIMGLGQEEFPQLPIVSSSNNYELSQIELLNMLKSISYAQSKDENRHILNGIYFNFVGKNLTLVATDGRRLGLVSKEINGNTDQKGSYILPAKTAMELERLLDQGGNVKISFNTKQVAFDINIVEGPQNTGLKDSIHLVSKLVDGNFPNYEQVIPRETAYRIKIDRELMLECLARAALVTSERNNSIKLTLSKNHMQISGSSPELGESQESMAIDFEEGEVDLIFNPQYLIDPLRALTKDEIYFEFKDELSPGLIKTMDSFLCVVMPLRLN